MEYNIKENILTLDNGFYIEKNERSNGETWIRLYNKGDIFLASMPIQKEENWTSTGIAFYCGYAYGWKSGVEKMSNKILESIRNKEIGKF